MRIESDLGDGPFGPRRTDLEALMYAALTVLVSVAAAGVWVLPWIVAWIKVGR